MASLTILAFLERTIENQNGGQYSFQEALVKYIKKASYIKRMTISDQFYTDRSVREKQTLSSNYDFNIDRSYVLVYHKNS